MSAPPHESPPPVLRRAARVLPVDAQDRVLLLSSRDPARPTQPSPVTVTFQGLGDGLPLSTPLLPEIVRLGVAALREAAA